MNRIVNGKVIEITPAEEIEIRAEWAANDALAAIKAIQAKRDMLIDYEKDQVVNAQVTAKRTAIEAMDDTALDAAIEAAGL